MTQGIDRAGQAFWDQTWERRGLPSPMDPDAPNLSAFVDRAFHRFFVSAFAGLDTPRARLVEIGCGASAWLPYFARQFGFRVAGVDYSELGAALARATLEKASVDGEVVLADFFAPPDSLTDAFDVVVSNGVVEHFDDPAAALAAIARFARPNGLVLTVIPNFAGALGVAQRLLDRTVYDVHVPLDRERLRKAHGDAGLEVQLCDYLLFTHFGVCDSAKASGVLAPLKRGLARVLVDLSRLSWGVESRTRPLRAGRWLGGYVAAVARRT